MESCMFIHVLPRSMQLQRRCSVWIWANHFNGVEGAPVGGGLSMNLSFT
jgi:hypothetical protein